MRLSSSRLQKKSAGKKKKGGGRPKWREIAATPGSANESPAHFLRHEELERSRVRGATPPPSLSADEREGQRETEMRLIQFPPATPARLPSIPISRHLFGGPHFAGLCVHGLVGWRHAPTTKPPSSSASDVGALGPRRCSSGDSHLMSFESESSLYAALAFAANPRALGRALFSITAPINGNEPNLFGARAWSRLPPALILRTRAARARPCCWAISRAGNR